MVMNLLNNVLGKKVNNAPAKRGYFKAMVVEDGDDLYDTSAEVIALAPVVNIKMRIWEFTCPAQMAVCWGYGSPAYPDNQGYIFFCFVDNGVGFSVGNVVLGHENHTRHNLVVVDDFNDNVAHGPDFTTIVTARAIDKNAMTTRPLPENTSIALVGQDSRLVIDYTAIVLVAEDTFAFSIPATVYD